ncbi:MAG: hypothetical protein DRQ88_01745 [Epsilonproteobacteria bacterium]|nr:MAG: hypothetical protein DRQ89_06310 [Campylobacterota bacterium]RLA67800.1 MAG: hypothetical protein DRQ88_01745 [Campylobacterota bacterium]
MSEKWNTLTSDNWTFCQYKSLKLKAFISLGGTPDQDIVYYVTCTDLEDKKDFFQTEYPELLHALEDINKRYGHWPLADLRAPDEEDAGCGSCSAH